MKRVICYLVLGMILVMSFASALSVDIRESYEPKETMIGKVSGNFLSPLSNENVEVKRGHVAVAVDFDLKKLGDDYYIWMVAPLNADTYTLWLRNVDTTLNGVPAKIDYAQNFTVGNATITDYYIKPGFVLTSKDFFVNAYLNKDVNQDIGVTFASNGSITLTPGENKINFPIDGVIYTGIYMITIGKYDFPAYIITGEAALANATVNGTLILNVTEKKNESVSGENYSLKFIPRRIMRIVYTGDSAIYDITIKNDGKDITDFSAEYDKNLFSIYPSIPSSLNGGEEFEFNLSVNRFKDYINSNITFDADGYNFYIPVEINFTSNKTEAKYTPPVTGQPSYYCEELLGKVCASGEKCSVTEVPSRNGNCCTGSCTSQSSGGGWGSWIGYLIAAIVLAGLGYLIYRYRSVKKETNPIERQVSALERRVPPAA